MSSQFYQPPPNKSQERNKLKNSMHLIPYEKEPVYSSHVDMSPTHLSQRRQEMPTTCINYMFSTTTGETHGAFSAQKKPEYQQLDARKAPAHSNLSYVASHQSIEGQKYHSGVYNTDEPTSSSIYLNPARKYISETKHQFQEQKPAPNVAHTWNNNVDRMRDRYVQLDKTQKKSLITQKSDVKSTSHALHGLDNTYFRTDIQESVRNQDSHQYCYRDSQYRGKVGGPKTFIQPKVLKEKRTEPLRDDVKVQQFQPLFHKGMSTHYSETHKTLMDTNPMVGKSLPVYASDTSRMRPEPVYGNQTTTMKQSYRPYSADDITNASLKDYTRPELRRPQILTKTRLDPGVSRMKTQYDNPGIGNQPMVDSRNLFMLSTQRVAAEHREALPARRLKDDRREEFNELLQSNCSHNRWKQ